MQRRRFWHPSAALKKSLEFYGKYHRNTTNRSMHLIGIPDIMAGICFLAVALFSASWLGFKILSILPAAVIAYSVVYHLWHGGVRGWVIVGLSVLFGYLAYSGFVAKHFWVWLWLEGWIFTFLVVHGVSKGRAHTEKLGSKAIRLAALTALSLMFIGVILPVLISELSVGNLMTGLVLLVVGVIYHLPGHIIFEGNKPAFKDDIKMAITAAPHDFILMLVSPFRKDFPGS